MLVTVRLSLENGETEETDIWVDPDQMWLLDQPMNEETGTQCWPPILLLLDTDTIEQIKAFTITDTVKTLMALIFGNIPPILAAGIKTQ